MPKSALLKNSTTLFFRMCVRKINNRRAVFIYPFVTKHYYEKIGETGTERLPNRTSGACPLFSF